MNKPTTANVNRRGSRRQQVKRSTRVSCFRGPLGIGPNLLVSVLDVSETGVRLVLKELVEKGRSLEVHLEGVWQREPIKVSAEVVWVVPTADGNFCVGAQLQRRLHHSDLQSLAYS
jgi:hypothetical protein